MVVLATGSGFLVATLNLAAQNAAHLNEMDVVSSFTQFSCSMGATLGSAALGSILLVQREPQVAAASIAPLAEMRVPLGAALHWVFLASALLMAVGLVASIFIRELPIRRRRQSPPPPAPAPRQTVKPDYFSGGS
jgi:hypothetical protein